MDTTSQIFDPSRIEKISKIMPNFSKVARVGDTVLMGLDGDPAFPYPNGNRVTGQITDVQNINGDNHVTIQCSDGNVKTVNSFTIAPGEVWEFSDESFASVLERERREQEMTMRANSEVMMGEEKRMNRAEESQYKAIDHDLQTQIAELRAELESERQLTRNFHNTYIASLHELANDVCKIADKSGTMAQFCNTFNTEYSRMVSRAENGVYRGTTNDDDDEQQQQQEEEEEEDEFEDDEEELGSDVESLSADEDFNGQSDYF